MNKVSQGYSRDRRIIELVERCGALSTGQIAVMLFGDLKAGYRKCQQRLQRLAHRKQLSRVRLAANQPYIYCYGRPMTQIEHRVSLNWSLIWLLQSMATWERVVDWEYEPDYGHVRPDLLFVADNTFTKQFRAVYVELDRSDRNRWDKTGKYNRLYAEEGYRGSWWVEQAARFPSVLIATTTGARAQLISSAIEKENKHNLRFDVRLQRDLLREAWPWGEC